MKADQKHHKVFYGWWIVGASFLIQMYSRGIVGFGFTAIIDPIAGDFGWSYAQISLATTIRGLVMFVIAPLAGFLVDRWGPRQLVFGGSLIAGLGLMFLSRISALSTFYLAFGLISLGRSMCNLTIMATAAANWFRKRVGIATGILTSASGVGGLMVPLVTMLTDTFKWQTAVFSLGLGMLVLGLPLSLIIRHKPEQYGYLPDGDVNTTVVTEENTDSSRRDEVNITTRQALASKAFWYMALTAACWGFVVSTIITHIMPYLSSIDIARSTSSLVATALPLVSICGRLGFGWLGDRVGKKQVVVMSCALISLGLFSLGYIPNVGKWLLPIFIVLFSIGWGGCAIGRIGLLREHFGRSRIGTMLGFSLAALMVGEMIGPPLAGWAFDKWGSYQGVWFAYSVVALVGLASILIIPRSLVK